MKCPRCQCGNCPGAKFCEEWAAPLARRCGNLGSSSDKRALHDLVERVG